MNIPHFRFTLLISKIFGERVTLFANAVATQNYLFSRQKVDFSVYVLDHETAADILLG